MNYKDELNRAMKYLAGDKKTIFLGQSVACSGNGLYETLKDVPLSQRLEMPVAEDLQMGISIGLSLNGFIPISIYPRMDFLLLAINQMVNHLDKIEEISYGHFKPKVIIRTALGATKPMYPGLQHCSDYTNGIRSMLQHIQVVSLTRSEDIFVSYVTALESKGSTLLIEDCDMYNDSTISTSEMDE